MAAFSESAVVQKMVRADLAVSVLVNRVCHREYLRRFFAAVSRLGDGVLWYVVMALLPLLYGVSGLVTTVHMLLSGVIALGIYKLNKQHTERARPFAVTSKILRGTAPLDEYSFPSGHTLHAVVFTLTACSAHPELVLALVPFALCVAASRIVLGLHFLTDVIAGAAIGVSIVYLLAPIGAELRGSLVFVDAAIGF